MIFNYDNEDTENVSYFLNHGPITEGTEKTEDDGDLEELEDFEDEGFENDNILKAIAIPRLQSPQGPHCPRRLLSSQCPLSPYDLSN